MAHSLVVRSHGFRPYLNRVPGPSPMRSGDRIGDRWHREPGRAVPFRPHRHADMIDGSAQIAPRVGIVMADRQRRSEEHTSELQSLMRISYAVFCLKKKKTK